MASFIFCGLPSLCRCFTGFLICTGINITVFPLFEESVRFKTVHIDLSDTGLKNIPNIEPLEWPMLHSLDLRGTSISCQEAYDFMMKHRTLTVYYLCGYENVTGGNPEYTTSVSMNPVSRTTSEMNSTEHVEILKPYMITTVFEVTLSLVVIAAYMIYRTVRIMKIRLRHTERELPLFTDLVHRGETSHIPRISTM